MSAPEFPDVTLRTGAKVPLILAKTTYLALQSLMDQHPIALYEAAMIARDKSHVPFGNTGRELEERGLLDMNGRMHDAVRDVILAATEPEEFDMRLVSPFADDAPEVTA